MKRFSVLSKRSSRLRNRSSRFRRFSTQHGLSLVELLFATILTSLVILVAWSGVIAAKTTLQASESRATRQSEMNSALDFMSAEIRMARAINQTGNTIADGVTVTLADVIIQGGVPLAALGDYGTLGLYLERPVNNPPLLCPLGGPNAGLPPPAPTDYDPVVYDIRPSPSGWLKPRMLSRYGRVPGADGTINPCSSPVSSDPMVDALSASVAKAPDCAGLLSGSGGFHSCMNGNQVNLFFQSDISDTEVKQVSTSVSSRVAAIPPISSPTPTGTCDALNINGVSFNNGYMRIDWSCSNNPSNVTYEVYKHLNSTQTLVYTGSNTTFTYNHFPPIPGQTVCLHVESVTNPRRTTPPATCLNT